MPGHRHDHGDVDHGFVVRGQCLVVADAAAELADPGECALDDPAAGQHGEALDVVGAFDHLDGQCQDLAGPDDQPSRIAAVGPDQADRGEPAAKLGQVSSRYAASRSWMPAMVTTTASSSPPVSTAMWRLRPLTFFPAS